MSEIDNGGPAFPVLPPLHETGHGSASGYPFIAEGMSLRDWFAGQVAGHALYLASHYPRVEEVTPCQLAAAAAYEMADEMLAARQRPRTEVVPS